MSTASGSLAVLRERYGERYRWLLLLSVMVGTMASIMSSTIVNVAIPDMSHYFTLGQERAQWVTSGFMVATTVSMLTTPWLLSRYGYRATYVGAMLLLLAGGVGGGLARDFGLVLAARVAEGLAAGVVQPIPAVIILYAFQPHEQGRASGIFGMGVVLAPALGPSIGGLLVDWFGWRSIFFMVVPLCLASLWLAYKFVPASAPGGVEPNRQGEALDWRGLLLGSVGTLCLLNGLVSLHGGSMAEAATLLAIAVVCVAAFIAWQRRLIQRGRKPLMDLRLFQYRQFAMGSVVAFIYGTALFGSTYLLPVFMQLGLELSASHVGTLMLAQRVGRESFSDYLERFGLGQRTGVELAGESDGLVPDLQNWQGGSFANLPIGQGLSMTTLQMAGVYQTIANDGVRVPPRIIAERVGPDGESHPAERPEGQRVVSEETARTVRDMFRAVTQSGPGAQSGTGPQAAIAGYQISGKTGTAQQIDPGCSCYSNSRYWITFAGILPADDPRYVIAIMLDAPSRGVLGASAAPLFHDIASWLINRDNIPPSAPAPDLVLQAQ